MKSTPKIPPQSAINAIETNEGVLIPLPFSEAQIKIAGIVKIAPAANDSPAEPIVCTMLFSRIESFFIITLITPIEITAAGIEADTVIPTLSPK